MPNWPFNSIHTGSSPKHHSASEHGDCYAISSSEARTLRAKHEDKMGGWVNIPKSVTGNRY
jgi:hypothetical protein